MQFTQRKQNRAPDPFWELIRQKQELKQIRKEMIEQLYETIAELEGKPARRLDIGFPLNLIVRFVYKALGTLEALVRRIVAAIIK